MKVRPSARSVSWEALRGVAAGRGDAEPLLRKLLQKSELPPVERRLAFELTLGTLRRRGYLDYGLGFFLKRPLKKLHPDLLELFRLGAYQLLELDRIPSYAAVSQAVDLARTRSSTRKAAGMVNAVLRRLSENFPEPPDRSQDPAEYLSVTGSHPRWLIDRWLGRFGFAETERLCALNNETPNTYIFLNPFKSGPGNEARLSGLDAGQVEGFSGCHRISRGADITSHQMYRSGELYTADPATALAALVLEPRPGELILDACSAPGGKLFHLHRLAGKGLETVSVDISPRRCAVLLKNVLRLGIPTAIVNADLQHTPFRGGGFDKVLLDVPCSNTGVLRRRVEARWRRKPGDIETLARLQLDLLHSASRLVKSAGLLAYSTCSLEPEENEGVVNSFLAQSDGFRLVPGEGGLTKELSVRFGDTEGYIRALPHLTNTDGAFVALLQRVR